MVKTIVLKSSLLVFLSEAVRKNVVSSSATSLSSEESEEFVKAKEFFGVEDLNVVGEFSSTLENVLWSLFEKIPAPESPLRLKAHERFLQETAAELEKTLKSEDLPALSTKALLSVVDMVEDPEKFKAITFPFEYKLVDGTSRILQLPSVNILSNDDFVSTLDTVFGPTKEA